MDPELTKQLNRRRLILESSLKTSIKNENKVKYIESYTSLNTDVIQPKIIKNNFLEKIKKFESFSDTQIKITQQNIVDKSRNNIEILNKFNKLNLDIVLEKTNKIELDTLKGLCKDNVQKQDNIYKKIKQFETSFILENKILKENTSNFFKKQSQTRNEISKKFKIKSSSKSDYNNWKLDETWVFSKNFPNLNNKEFTGTNKF